MDIKKGLAIGIILLLIVTSTTPFVLGYNQYTIDKDEMDDDLSDILSDLRFDCADDSGCNAIYDYYKEMLLEGYEEPLEKQLEFIDANKFIEPPINPITSFGPMNSSWPMKSHDLRHTGRSPYSTKFVDGSEKWRFYTRSVEGGISIDDDGIIYVPGGYSTFFAVYPDGTEKWSYDAEGLLLSTPAISEDGTIYFSSFDDHLYAINPDGNLKWRYDTDSSLSSSPAIAEDGTIYIGGMGPGWKEGRIYAINPNGTEKWHYDAEYLIESDPAIGDDGTIYIGSMDGYLYAINPNGTLKWRFETDHEIHNHPSISEDGTIYISSFDEYLYAINPDGTEKWRYNTVRGSSAGHAIGEDGTIYAGSDDFYAINPDGTLKWIFNLDGYFIAESSPAISSDGTIYVGIISGEPDWPESGFIIAINPDGTEKWRKMLVEDSMYIDSSPAIAEDGTVYIGSHVTPTGGYLHAFGNYNDLKINEIQDGFGKVRAIITNNLDHAIEDIDIIFTVQGGILDLIDFESHVTIDSLDSGESRIIRSDGLILGLGPVDINVKAICDEVGEVSLYEPGFVLLFLVLKTS